MFGAAERRSSCWELVRAHNKSTESGSAPDTRDQQQSTHGKQPLCCFPSQQSRVTVLLSLARVCSDHTCLPSPAHTTARCVLSSVPQQSPWMHLYKQESLAIRLATTTGAGAARIFAGLPVVVVVDSARLSPTAQVQMKGLRAPRNLMISLGLFSRLRSPSKSLLSTNLQHHLSC
ncbi:unnamed protein product, partial [Ectocarpus sp. 8 AP-2014]